MPHCCFGNCNSDSRPGRPGYDASVKFYPFPQPCLLLRDNVLEWDENQQKKHTKLCAKCHLCWSWMERCKRKDNYFSSVRFVRSTTRICSKHFASPLPNKMDFKKYFPLSSVPRERSSRFRKRPADQADSSSRSSGGEFASRYVAQNVPTNSEALVVESNAAQTENKFASPTLVGSGFVEIDGIPQAQAKTRDAYTQTESRTKEVSTQTTWVVKDVDDLLEKIGNLNLKIQALQEEIKKMGKNPKNSDSIANFEVLVETNEKACLYYTGLASGQFNALKLFCKDDTISPWGYSAPSGKVKKDGRNKLTRNQELLLFFLRVRGGLLLQDIAYRFGLAKSSVSRTVTKWINFLFSKFDSLRPSMFPPREIMKLSLPPRFRRFKNIRLIIDCAEIFCEKPSNFEQQGNSFSHYKSHTTFKVLIGCAPNGAVCFVSELFEGSISDREIVIQSGLFDLLNEGDLVLADRGFTVKDLADEKGVNLKIPAFLRGRDCLSPQEEVATKEIAANRIFVEHVVGRLKNFRLLRRVLPLSMRYTISQTVFICACLLNFHPPIVQ